MNIWDDPKFSRPTDAVGDWHVVRCACFEHDNAPTAMKYACEKMTCQLLQREPLDVTAPALRYAGTSSAGGHPSTVRLDLVAIGGGTHLYALTNERSAPKCWEEEQPFTAACERSFAHLCAQLRIVEHEQAWPRAPHAMFEQYVLDVVAAEEAAARVTEDLAPVIALQRQVLDAMRGRKGFFKAGKEGSTRLFFDGTVFRRSDCGEGPDFSTVYADEAGMIDGLRRFFDWDARHDSYPHPKPESEVWKYILTQMRPDKPEVAPPLRPQHQQDRP